MTTPILLSIPVAAHELGVGEHVIRYAIRRGLFTPSVLVSGRYVFTPDDVNRLKKYLPLKPTQRWQEAAKVK